MSDNKEYMRKYVLSRYHARMDMFRKYLGGRCVICGVDEELEFDHIDRNTKVMNIASMAQFSDVKVYEELEKCQLLCKKHHLEKSYREGDLTTPFQHGTLAGYRYCSCEDCRLAKREYMRSYRKKKASHRNSEAES